MIEIFQQQAQSLVMQLQLMIAKLNANLEEQSEQVCQAMPKIVREIDALQHETVVLQSSMSVVQSDIDQVNQETGASMETLVKMDALKQKIQDTKKALKEADNWTTLTTEIEDTFDNHDIVAISAKLNGIQNSLKILSHAEDYEEKCRLVEELKNRLEALASPQLVAAFNAGDSGKSQFFVQLYADMERSSQLLNYYRKWWVRAKALKTWAVLVEDHEQYTVQEWSQMYFTYLLKEVGELKTWFQQVFKVEISEHLLEMLVDAFRNLDPTLEFCFQAGLKMHQSDSLSYLTAIKASFNQFLQQLDQELPTYSQTKMRELSLVLYAPFKLHLKNYQALVTTKLLQELETNNSTTSKDILDELRLISMSVPKLITSFKSASEQCLLLSESCSFPALVNGLEECLIQYLERFLNLMRRLEKRKTAAHSWNILQQSLTLNQTCGDLLLNLEELDISLAISFLDKASKFFNNQDQKVIFQHHIFLLDKQNSSLKKLQEFHSKVKQNPTVLTPLFKHIQSTCADLQNCTFNILFYPVKEQLSQVSSETMLEQVWTSADAGADTMEPDMPDFSFSPQEYITQIGQYLMTMPQHLEPYMTNDNPALSRALQVTCVSFPVVKNFFGSTIFFLFHRKEYFLFVAVFVPKNRTVNLVTPLLISC